MVTILGNYMVNIKAFNIDILRDCFFILIEQCRLYFGRLQWSVSFQQLLKIVHLDKLKFKENRNLKAIKSQK